VTQPRFPCVVPQKKFPKTSTVPNPVFSREFAIQCRAGARRWEGKGRKGETSDGDGVFCAALFSLFSLPY